MWALPACFFKGLCPLGPAAPPPGYLKPKEGGDFCSGQSGSDLFASAAELRDFAGGLHYHFPQFGDAPAFEPHGWS